MKKRRRNPPISVRARVALRECNGTSKARLLSKQYGSKACRPHLQSVRKTCCDTYALTTRQTTFKKSHIGQDSTKLKGTSDWNCWESANLCPTFPHSFPSLWRICGKLLSRKTLSSITHTHTDAMPIRQILIHSVQALFLPLVMAPDKIKP